MAPHAMDTILQTPQWPASLSQFVTWCLMWDPKARPTSTQALAHEYFTDALDPLRPKSSASRILGRKHSDLSYRGSRDFSDATSSKPSWFRKSLIGRSENAAVTPPQASNKENIAPRPLPVHASTQNEISVAKGRPQPGKRNTWANGPSNGAPMPILPTIRPISPLSDAVTAQASGRTPSYSASHNALTGVGGQRSSTMDEKTAKKIGRQLSVASSNNHYDPEVHRQQAERALNGNGGLASPPSGQKESFFSHLRKRARRFSGRHQTPISPSSDDIEAQAGCGPWASNRSSMILDASQLPTPSHKVDTHEALDKALRTVQQNLDSPYQNNSPHAPAPPSHQISPSSVLKRHHSLPHQQTRSAENLGGAARSGGPISSRTRRAQAQGVRQYETPDEEDELLDEALVSSQKAIKRLDRSSMADMSRTTVQPKQNIQQLRQSSSNLGPSNSYPTPSPSANGSTALFGQNVPAVTSTPIQSSKPVEGGDDKWPTPPYGEKEWAESAAASIWAAGNRF